MRADAEGFLQRIRAYPDDDVPRLIYADWLDEQGDPRGEFIRVQVALANLPDDGPPRRALLSARAGAARRLRGRLDGPLPRPGERAGVPPRPRG